MNDVVIIALVFVGVFTLYLAIISIFDRKQRVSSLELKAGHSASATTILGDDTVPDLVSLDYEPQGLASHCKAVLTSLGVNTKEKIKAMEKTLVRAGIASQSAPYYLLFMEIIGKWVIVLIGVALLLSNAYGKLIPFVIMGVGLLGAWLFLRNQTARHQKKLNRSFPDALDLLVVCVESGLALDAALARVCKELGRAHPGVTKELNRTRLELALLNDRSQALQNLAERTNIVPFRSLVAALIQTERFGTSLTDTLRVLSDDSRIARLMIAEQKAGRLPAMMAVPLICFLLPALFIVILGPAIINASQTLSNF